MPSRSSRRSGAKIGWPASVSAVLAPRDQLTVSEWADRYRILSSRFSAEPGPWRTSRVPYLREPMDAFAEDGVEIVVAVWATQLGKTEGLCVNCAGWVIDQNPAPALFVAPVKEPNATRIAERLVDMVRSSPRLRGHLTGSLQDAKGYVKRFDTCTLRVGWAGSPASLASDPICYVWLDETDKFPSWSGQEADPIALALERTKTFRTRRKIVLTSTPTTQNGYIWRAWQRALQHHYWVPCPHCGEYQVLRFGIDTVRWPEDERDPDRIRSQQLAWYECEHCHERIDDHQKPAMLTNGRWLQADQTITRRRKTVGAPQASRVVGYHLNALYSPWLTWSDVAAAFLASKDEPARLMNFRNSWEALPWIEAADDVEADELERNILPYDRGLVPSEAEVLVAAVDVHSEVGPPLFYYVLRAFGAGETSWLVREGVIEGWEALTNIVLGEYPRENGGVERARLVGIDCRYRTGEVYAWCERHREVARPLAGHGKGRMHSLLKPVRVDYRQRSGRVIRGRLVRWNVDVGHYKAALVRHIQTAQGEPGAWYLHRQVSPEYCEQVTSEHLVRRYDRRGHQVEVWEAKRPGVENHYLDCEVYALVLADMLGVRHLRSRDETPKTPRPRRRPLSQFLDDVDGWWSR